MSRHSASPSGDSNIVLFPQAVSPLRAAGGCRRPSTAQTHSGRVSARQPARLDPALLDRQSLRLLGLLTGPDTRACLDEASTQVIVIGRKSGVSLALGRMSQEQAEVLCKRFWLRREQDKRKVNYLLTPLARQALSDTATASPQEEMQGSGQDRPQLKTNPKESPLLWLARRKNSQGMAHISPTQLLAGERLRRDYTQAGMTPKMTANWSGLPVAGPASAIGLNESERMLDSRQRLRAALEACGSSHAGVLLDICCFLKPLEQVERDRGWRARTGKYALVKALNCLAAHYGLSETAQGRSHAPEITVWKA